MDTRKKSGAKLIYFICVHTCMHVHVLYVQYIQIVVHWPHPPTVIICVALCTCTHLYFIIFFPPSVFFFSLQYSNVYSPEKIHSHFCVDWSNHVITVSCQCIWYKYMHIVFIHVLYVIRILYKYNIPILIFCNYLFFLFVWYV